ncbi:glycosyltransferase family 4 protein [Patescibacteria group bacterium]|nr:glycosyltransferase family 4 protein [Patescibacteria group bacterium]
MKAAIYNPYLDTLGGGERYSMAVATALFDVGYQVDVQWEMSDIKRKLEDRFGIVLDGVNFVPDVKRGDGYDICFWVSDGSIPTLKARKNFLHFQVPFDDVNGKTLLNRMKLFRINKIICNSNFTKSFIDKEYGVKSIVIYPPVDVEKIKPKRKEKMILSVGRFSQLKQAKRQDVLIEAFKKLYDKGYRDWRLVLAGGVEVGVGNYIEKLKKMAEHYPVEIFQSPDFKTLKDLYGRAKIFWSAAGFGINEEKEPERVEHFGISVVEAMCAGDVPIVLFAGGHKEIISEGINGYGWTTIGQLIKKSIKLINDRILFKGVMKEAIETCNKYGYEQFRTSIKKIL